MKKLISLLLILTVSCAFLFACKPDDSDNNTDDTPSEQAPGGSNTEGGGTENGGNTEADSGSSNTEPDDSKMDNLHGWTDN